MKLSQAFTELAQQRGDAIVVCALGTAANEWWAVTRCTETFYMHGAMGFAASFALGLAVALPEQPVWVLNADGSLCMNLGCLLTEAGQQPRNLMHFVVDNGVYQTVGAVPMVNQRRTDYAAIARGAGIGSARTIADLDGLREALPGVLQSPGPQFTVLQVEPEQSHLAVPPMPFEGPEMKYRFGRAIERKLGIAVFGPSGY